MTDQDEHRIRERAHQLWIEDGQPQGRALDYWLRAQNELAAQGSSDHNNEGEGSQSGARDYGEQVEKFVKSGRVAAKAKEAKAAVDGPEGPELKRAEEIGKRRSRGEDPKVTGA